MNRFRVLSSAGVAAVLLVVRPAPAGDIAPNFEIFNVPLTIHVVRPSDGNGGLSAIRVGQAIIDANVAFQPMGIYFCKIGPTIFHDDDDLYTGLQTHPDYAALKQLNPVPDTINIWFTEEMGCPSENQADCPNPQLCGISSYTNTAVQGIVMRNSCTGVPEDRSTIAHELGHYFNLYHTQDTWTGIECPDGSNCAFDGDLICDTPASPRLDLGNVNEQTCAYEGDQTACGQPYVDPLVCNHMSYAPKPCRDAFTLQQVARARATLQNYRSALILDPGCPAPGACSLASEPCNVPHDTPGCNDGPCCMDVCDLDLYCCAAEWDATCVWKRSFVCLDIAIPPFNPDPHAPLGDAVLAIDPSSGALVVSNIGASGDDGVVAELDFAKSMDIAWIDPDPAGALPSGANMSLSLSGWTGMPRPQPAGSSTVTKQGGASTFVEVSAALGAPVSTVRVYQGPSLVAETTVTSASIATVPVMPTGGGIPDTVNDGPRLYWSWAAPVVIQVEGAPVATGTRLEIHADGSPRARWFAMLGLQAGGLSQVDITGETVTTAAAPLNDDCRDPFLVGDETVSFAGESWYLYIATCDGPVTANAGTSVPVTAYTGTCDDLQQVGTGVFTAACGVPYLLHVGAGTGALTVSCSGTCVLPCTADLDVDSNVGILDFLMLLAAWGPNAGHPADFDGDGFVGITDFLFLLSDWGPCPSLID